jgi:hypothetical protein
MLSFGIITQSCSTGPEFSQSYSSYVQTSPLPPFISISFSLPPPTSLSTPSPTYYMCPPITRLLSKHSRKRTQLHGVQILSKPAPVGRKGAGMPPTKSEEDSAKKKGTNLLLQGGCAGGWWINGCSVAASSVRLGVWIHVERKETVIQDVGRINSRVLLTCSRKKSHWSTKTPLLQKEWKCFSTPNPYTATP